MKKSIFRKAVCLLAVLSMVLCLVPHISVSAASPSGRYTYYITVKNGDVGYAGTDGNVYCVVKTYSRGERIVKIDSSANDFERNNCREYGVSLDVQPWEIKEVGLWNDSTDGAYFSWFDFKLPGGATFKTAVNAWFEKGKNKTARRTYGVKWNVARKITATGDFEANFSGTKYYDVNETTAGTLTLKWNGKVSDQYFENYNFFDYAGAAGITFKVSGTSYIDPDEAETINLAKEYVKYLDADEDGMYEGITLDMDKVLPYMQKNKIYKLNINSSIKLNGNYDINPITAQDYTIIRTGFDFEDGETVIFSTPYMAGTDKNFYNSEKETFRIKIPVKEMDHYNATYMARDFPYSIEIGDTSAKVYYGEVGSEDYIIPTVTASNDEIFLECDISTVSFANPEGTGITVVIENAKVRYPGYPKQTYTLDRENAQYKLHNAAYKVDTKGLTHTVTDETGNKIDTSTGFDEYEKEHAFKLNLDGVPYITKEITEFYKVNSTTYWERTVTKRISPHFSYKLYNETKTDEIELEPRGTVKTSEVQHADNAVYRVATKDEVEGEYILEIKTWDLANNLTVTDVPIKLDNMAPRVQCEAFEVVDTNGEKRNEYTFTIEDESGTGRLYYAFVRDGDEYDIPDISDAPDGSGSVDNVYETWGFINQTNDDAQTIVLAPEKGESFNGTLYWYTVDDAGNNSTTEIDTTTMKDTNGYYYKDRISLSNIPVECEIAVNDVTDGKPADPESGKPEYDISFVTDDANTVRYRWVGVDNSLITEYTTYDETCNPGTAVQKDGSGNEVTLNGKYKLIYEVVTPEGAMTEYQKEFVFDNTKPHITYVKYNEEISPTKSMGVTVQDISDISSLVYELYKADGASVGEVTEIPLTSVSNVVSSEFTVSPEMTGAYKIKVTATDKNGQTSELESDVFSVRTTEPAITLTGNSSISNSQEYTVTLTADEDVISISEFESDQVLRYRTSPDGINYCDWVTVEDVSISDDNKLCASAELPSPVALNSTSNGNNTVFVQAAFTEKDNTDKILTELIASADFVITYDAQAPQYSIKIDESGITNESVFGTLTYTDDITPATDIELVNENDEILLSEKSTTGNVMVLDVEIVENVKDGKIYLTDAAGNTAEINISVDFIDKAAPEYELIESETIESGERQDYSLKFYIDGAMSSETVFALVAGEGIDVKNIDDELFEATPDSVDFIKAETVYDYESGETKTEYEIIVRAGAASGREPDKGDFVDEESYNAAYDQWYESGGDAEEPEWNDFVDEDAYLAAYNEWISDNPTNYVLAVKALDALGNTVKYSIPVEVKNAPVGISEEVWCFPQLACTSAAIGMVSTVPVYVVPENKVPKAISKLDLPDGRIDNSDNETVMEFAESVMSMATSYNTWQGMTIGSIGEKAIYFADECGRIYKQTVTVKDLSDWSEDNWEPYTCYVSFGNEPPVSVGFYKADKGDMNESDWTAIDASEVQTLNFDENDYYIVFETEDASTVLLEGTVSYDINSEYDFTCVDDLCEVNDSDEYTKLVFAVESTENLHKILECAACVEIENPNDEYGTLEDVGSVIFELDLKDITGPATEVYYSTKGYTNSDVTATVFASDSELAETPDAYDENSSDDEAEMKDLTPEEIAQQSGIKNISISDISTVEITGDYSALSYTDLGQVSQTSVTFEENGYAVVKVTNTLGLVSYKLISVQNINKSAIEENVHYNIKYYSDAVSKAEMGDSEYCKEVVAAIEFTDDGNERGLYVANNMAESSKTLDNFESSFTFVLKDKYGTSAEVEVRFDRFDSAGPIVKHELSNANKTNKPIDVYFDVYDVLTDVGDDALTLTAPDGSEIEVEFVSESTDDETEITTKRYKATVSEGGLYKLTAADVCENVSYLNFTISNIDTTEPSITQIMAISTLPTTQTVGVKLHYSKPGVILTHVNPVEYFGNTISENDYMVDYRESSLRFNENGAVRVVFVDEYGNEGEDYVTVGNINRTPPSLVAKAETAEDLLSVEITFEQELNEDGYPKDIMRDISELAVLYQGVGSLDDEGNVVSADKAKYTIIENGTYTFHVIDSIGNIQAIEVEVTGIDKRAPVITQISYSYTYYDESGTQQTASRSITPGDEAGYNVVEDATNMPTNQDVTATVTTDLPTKFEGSYGSEYKTDNSVVFDKDGWFNFNLERENGLADRYGLGIYLIDKEPPVIEGVNDLMFFENSNAGTPYSKDLLVYSAYDERYDEKTDLTDKVEIDWGGFNPDDIKANIFDKNKPYTITYTVKDAVGNETQVKRTITLVGLYDPMAHINGIYPDSSGRIEVIGDAVKIGLDNFSGKAYARYEKGFYTMGEMKYLGAVIEESGNNTFTVDKLTEGWYTFYIQTDLRDYFCINVYVSNR